MYELYEKVLLTDGRTATIVERFGNGDTYLADIDGFDGDITTDFIEAGEIAGLKERRGMKFVVKLAETV